MTSIASTIETAASLKGPKTSTYNGAQGAKKGPPLVWKEVFRATEGDLTVVVTSSGGFRPRYSFMLGKIRPDGTVAPHNPVRVETDLGQVSVANFARATAELLEKAEEYITTEATLSGQADLDHKLAKEQRNANFGKQPTRVTGKTAKKKEKFKNKSASASLVPHRS